MSAPRVKLDLSHFEAATTFGVIAHVIENPEWYDHFNARERAALDRVNDKIAGQLRIEWDS